MSKIIIGIDPDSQAHGVAWYVDGKLTDLYSFTLIDLLTAFNTPPESSKNIEVHIEDVCANNALFNTANNQKIAGAMGRSIGKLQQSQVELERLFEFLEIKVVKHKISKMWKKDKSQFEKITGWTRRSNEDTRSAAYFGWLGVKK